MHLLSTLETGSGRRSARLEFNTAYEVISFVQLALTGLSVGLRVGFMVGSSVVV
jgi:hypothetical protein